MLFPLMLCRLAQSLVMGAESAQKVLLPTFQLRALHGKSGHRQLMR